MGIVNVTPDSFSDGGKYFRPEEAIRRARRARAEGAAIVDIGGESTRPGAEPLGWEEEWERIGGVLAALRGTGRISVDTYHPETAERALSSGATMLNLVKKERLPEFLELARAFPEAELVAPFRPGDDAGVFAGLGERVYLDPMIGFGTTREEDLGLLRAIPKMCSYGRVAIGVSRKRIVCKLIGEKTLGKDAGGSVALAVWCALKGASLVRVHDVGETVRALKVIERVEDV